MPSAACLDYFDVAAALFDGPELRPLLSRATTKYRYDIPCRKPLSVYERLRVVAMGTVAVAVDRQTWYVISSVLFVSAHERAIVRGLLETAMSDVGAVGCGPGPGGPHSPSHEKTVIVAVSLSATPQAFVTRTQYAVVTSGVTVIDAPVLPVIGVPPPVVPSYH